MLQGNIPLFLSGLFSFQGNENVLLEVIVLFLTLQPDILRQILMSSGDFME